MSDLILPGLQTLNEILSAGIAITAASLLLYTLSFTLRDRVTRSFAIILICVFIVFVGDTISSTAASMGGKQFWLRLQWVGIAFLPAAYVQLSDALQAITGRPSQGWKQSAARLTYLVSLGFLFTLPFNLLVGPIVPDGEPAPHLERTPITWVFTAYYAACMTWAWINFFSAYQRTVTSAGKRRLQYLITGALAPALGSYPFLLFGSGMAANHPFLFWFAVITINLIVYALLILMAYAVAFFGVPWPDRVVKRRLIKWLMRGPVTASAVLGITTLVRRAGLAFGFSYTAAVPFVMVGSILIIEHMITLLAPLVERFLLYGGDRANMQLLHSLEERLLTTSDLKQFLESVLAAVCDRLQAKNGFLVTLGEQGIEIVVTTGSSFFDEEISDGLLELVSKNSYGQGIFSWGDFWLVPLFESGENEQNLLGLLGVRKEGKNRLDNYQRDALDLLANRAALAIEDRNQQQRAVMSLHSITPQVDLIQRLRAASRFAGTSVLTSEETPDPDRDVARWVKDALTHYWGGPKLTNSPLLRFQIVKNTLEEHDGNPVKALRSILNQAIEATRPEGERRFTGEWILYNILEMKFLEGRKVRDIAMRLAMSEADLYRKQRVAIEAVAAMIVDMERKAVENENGGGKSLAENH